MVKKICVFFLAIALCGFSHVNAQSNITSSNSFAWSEEIGWINFQPDEQGVVVSDQGLSGYAWSDTYGWINLSPTQAGVDVKTIVLSDGSCESELSGHAWGTNVGWIDFSGVKINDSGDFSGTAQGEITGKISFSGNKFTLKTDYRPSCSDDDAHQVQDNTSQGELNTDVEQNLPSESNELLSVDAQSNDDRDYDIDNAFESCDVVANIKSDDYTYEYGIFADEGSMRYLDEIMKFRSLEIINGYEDGTFGPERSIKRAEYLKILFRSHCIDYSDIDTAELDFEDVDKNSWQARVVAKAVELGIVNGHTLERTNQDGETEEYKMFHPNDTISKIEATKILMKISGIQYNLQNYTGDGLSTYMDIYVGWYDKYVENGILLGLFNPDDEGYLFLPDLSVDRQYVVYLMHSMIELY